MKITTFAISLVIISVFVALLGVSMAEMNASKAPTLEVNATEFEPMNQLSNMTNMTGNTKAKLDTIRNDQQLSLLDISLLIGTALDAVKIMISSFGNFMLMASFALVGNSIFGAAGAIILSGICVIILLGVFIAGLIEFIRGTG